MPKLPLILLLSIVSLPLPAAEPTVPPPTAPATVETPTSFPGAETLVYRETSPQPVRLFVFKPEGWAAHDRRPALIWFYGGGWNHGSPVGSVPFARWAAEQGLVGIAPDYRVRQRFGTPPATAVADGRAALHWVQAHAAELGIDPQRIIVGGNSAGGHLALWTAITHTPPGSDPAEAPQFKPAALLLTSTVTDTTLGIGATYFGNDARALSPVHQADATMPPALLFHGDADPIVPYQTAVAMRDLLLKTGNTCELVTIPGGTHKYSNEIPGWREKQLTLMQAFLAKQHLLP